MHVRSDLVSRTFINGILFSLVIHGIWKAGNARE